MAASSFALACDALARERDRVFLMQVATDYKIAFEELEAKYLVAAESAIKVPKQKKVRAAKVSIEGKPEGERCQALTAKKGQCSFSPLKGECYCKRHLKQQSEAPKQDVPKPVKPEPKKAAAKVAPVHEHEIDDEKHAECDLCQTHGGGLAEEEEFEEAVEAPVKAARPSPEVSDSESDCEDEDDDAEPVAADSEAEVVSDFDEE
jgi:hypothetical protein